MNSLKKVMGFGTFDGLHPGHLEYLKQLRSLGDFVMVVVARDRNVERIKGRLPKYNEKERLSAVEATLLADEVMMGNEEDFMQCLRDHKPTVIGLGYDQKADVTRIQAEFPQIHIHRLKAYAPEKYKSSLLNT
ncbi:adenylyltransferase/cytidyltransferase family protein [Candidatus Peregrinibacteria bacterium]|nr:MAG: adenylyltransferase/cytidyltransferase family protein [Candidatus Peregrinibacteria bacterium]